MSTAQAHLPGLEETYALQSAMSALGHKQTFAAQNAMSALPRKADMCSALGHVGFGPIADIIPISEVGRLEGA
jgi:hypothetical protein